MHNIIQSITDLKHSEYCTLAAIKYAAVKNNGSKVKVSELSDIMHVNSTAVSRTLRELEQKAFIERHTSEKDRRITYVNITNDGKAALEKAEAQLTDFTSAVFERMGEDNLNRLTAYMNNLYDVMTEEIESRKKKGNDK